MDHPALVLYASLCLQGIARGFDFHQDGLSLTDDNQKI
jgi:hypothetical protein